MGVKFRKSINLGSGTRVNLSKKGVGVSVGNKYVRTTKKAGGGSYSTFTAPGTGLSYRSKESSTKKGSSSAKREYSSSNYSSGITGSSSYYSYEVDPVIECKRQILQLKSELEHKEKQIESLKLEMFIIPILQFFLCVFIITIPIALIYQGVKKKHRATIELLELDVLEIKINIKRIEDELEELTN